MTSTTHRKARPLRLPSNVKQHLFGSGDELADVLARRIATGLNLALGMHGRAALTVSGGSSPRRMFERLARQPLDWSGVTVTLADERWVEVDDADSNEALVRRHLLQHHAAQARFVPLKNPARSPEEGLTSACLALTALGQAPDILVLGVGEDGHTASLYPCAQEIHHALQPHAGLLAALHPARAPHARLSLTLPAILGAQAIVVLAAGPGKRRALEQAARCSDATMPIAAVLCQPHTPVHVYYAD